MSNKKKKNGPDPDPVPAIESPRRPGKKLVQKLALAVGLPLVCFGIVEGGLRLTGFSHQPQEKVLWKPTISGFIGTYEFYLPTDFSPPG